MNRTKVFQTKFGQGCWIDISVQQDPFSKDCGVTFISTGKISKAGVFYNIKNGSLFIAYLRQKVLTRNDLIRNTM